MQDKIDYIKKMWNNPNAGNEEALEWIIAHVEALGKRLDYYLKPEPAPEVTDE